MSSGGAFPRPRLASTVESLIGEAQMTHLLCQLFGHKKTRVPLSSNRYYCRRCGFDFGVDGKPTTAPMMPPIHPTPVKQGAARRLHR